MTATKTKKVKSWKSDPIPESQMIMRMVAIRPETANEESKTITVVIASENPVKRYNAETREVFSEILSMDGYEIRGGKDSLVIVDSHNRTTTRNVLGSIRNIRREGSLLVGDASFARDHDSQVAYHKVVDGHLTDFSITASPLEGQYIRRGDEHVFRGEKITGPAVIVTRWMPTDASLVAFGADEQSVVRNELMRSYFDAPGKEQEIKRMLSEELKAALVAKGMPEQIADVEQALTWAIGLLGGLQQQVEKPKEEVVAPSPQPEVQNQEEESKDMPAEETKKPDDTAAAVQRALESDRSRQKEIVALCDKANIERSFADDLYRSGVSLDVAREKILNKVVERNQPVGQSTSEAITFVSSGQDRTYAAMRDGLIARAYDAIGPDSTGNKRNPFAGGKPAAGYEDFSRVGFLRIAEEILRSGKVNTLRMNPKDIAMVALGHEPTINRMANLGLIQRGDAYHTTGTLPNLMLDAINKTLQAGYEEAPVTWNLWARQAPSTPDLKTINRVRFSESPDLEEVPENHAYPEKAMSDEKESYKPSKFGALFTVSWETIINDDLDAISRIPQMHGNAARRMQNKKVYQILTDNANMADGGALFNTTAQTTAGGHANLASSTGAPSVTTLNAGYLSMMTRKGINSTVIINCTPSFLIVPAALSATADALINSVADPAAGGSAVGNSNNHNIYGPQGNRRLRVIVEPQLDSNSATAWYLAASYNVVDTVELSFLQGEESPVLESEWDMVKDVYTYKIRQTFGVKAIDFRGLYKNAG